MGTLGGQPQDPETFPSMPTWRASSECAPCLYIGVSSFSQPAVEAATEREVGSGKSATAAAAAAAAELGSEAEAEVGALLLMGQLAD